MSYTVYILFSSKVGKFYKGQTNDMVGRLKSHYSGYEKSTSRGVPWIMVWSTIKNNRSDAQILESKLKNLSSIRLFEFIMKY